MTVPGHGRPVRAGDPILPADALAWLLHPITVGALALLLLNDHLLKAAWPGVVTGKLSDVAGLALTPPAVTAVLALLLPRLPVRVVAATTTLIVGITFGLVKVTALGAAGASAGWSWASGPSTVLPDPTDLLALPALAASWWALTYVRRHPLPGRATSLALTAIVLPMAGLAVLATSAVPYPSVTGVIVQDGPELVVIGSDLGESDAIVTTDGTNWSHLTGSAAAPLSRVDGSTRKACVPADPHRCYRTVPGRLAIEQTDDAGAGWTVAWSVSPGRQRFLARAYLDHGNGSSQVAARSLGVLATGDRQHVVVAAAGRDGILLRHPDGRWERIGFPTLGDLDLGYGPPAAPAATTAPGQRIAVEYVYLAVGLSGGLLLGGLAASSRRPQTWSAMPWPAVALGFLLAGLSLGGVLGVMSSVPAALTLIVAALVLWAAVVWSTGALTFTRTAVLTTTVVIAFALSRRPVVAWSSGQIDSYETAVRTATQLAVGSVITMTLVGLAFRLRDHRRAPDRLGPDRRGDT